MLQAIAEKTRMIRLPLNRITILTKVNKAYSKLEQEYERPPSHEEIAQTLDIGPEHITYTLKKAAHINSLDSTINSAGTTRLMDVLEDYVEVKPDTELMDQSLKDEINHILNCLTKREAQILNMYYGLNGYKSHTLEEIGMEFKLTRERIRQIKERVLNKLRTTKFNRSLSQYL